MTTDQAPRTWWQTVPGMITAMAGLLTAIGGLLTILLQAGIIQRDTGRSAETRNPPPSSGVESSLATRADPLPSADLETALDRANIQPGIGSADHIAEVRRYLSDRDGAYARLAQACLDVLGDRRLKRRGYLDMIDKWYTNAVGENRYLTEAGGIRREELMKAMVEAANEIDGLRSRSFDDIVESGR